MTSANSSRVFAVPGEGGALYEQRQSIAPGCQYIKNLIGRTNLMRGLGKSAGQASPITCCSQGGTMDFSKNNGTAVATFRIGAIFGRSFSILSRHFSLIVGLALAAALPGYLITLLFPATDDNLFITAASGILDLVLNLIVQGAMTYVVYQGLLGRAARFSEAVSASANRAAALFGVALLVTIGASIGLLLLVIPAIIVYCMWAVAVPVCVVEKLGSVASLSRSAKLTEGYRLRIFGLFLVAGMVSLVLVLCFSMLIGLALGFSDLNQSPPGMLLLTLVIVLAQAFVNVMVAVLYYDLRMVKEGLNLNSLASVFD